MEYFEFTNFEFESLFQNTLNLISQIINEKDLQSFISKSDLNLLIKYFIIKLN